MERGDKLMVRKREIHTIFSVLKEGTIFEPRPIVHTKEGEEFDKKFNLDTILLKIKPLYTPPKGIMYNAVDCKTGRFMTYNELEQVVVYPYELYENSSLIKEDFKHNELVPFNEVPPGTLIEFKELDDDKTEWEHHGKHGKLLLKTDAFFHVEHEYFTLRDGIIPDNELQSVYAILLDTGAPYYIAYGDRVYIH